MDVSKIAFAGTPPVKGGVTISIPVLVPVKAPVSAFKPASAPVGVDVRDRIMQYIEPSDRKECIGDPFFGLTIAKLMFSTNRDSQTAPYERGWKIPIRKDRIEVYIDSVKRKANRFYGQNFQVLPEQYEPEAFSP